MKRIEHSLRDLWDKIKHTNIRIIGVPEKVENFPNMGKEIVNQVQEVQSPIQDKSKEKQAKTHIDQTIKN